MTYIVFSFVLLKSPIFFEILHVDVWDPYNTTTHYGCKYFITIIDDYSRETWVQLMPNKLHSVSILTHFVHFVHTLFSAIVKIIRSDNTLELC